MNKTYRMRNTAIILYLFLLVTSIIYFYDMVIAADADTLDRILYGGIGLAAILLFLFAIGIKFETTPNGIRVILSPIFPFARTIMRKRNMKWEDVKEISYMWLYGAQLFRIVPRSKKQTALSFFLRIFLENPREMLGTVIKNCPHARVDEELIDILGKKDTFGKWLYVIFNGLFFGSGLFFLILFLSLSYFPIPDDDMRKAICLVASLMGSWLLMFIFFYYLESKNEDYYK